MDDTMITLIRSTLEAKASEIEVWFDATTTTDVEPDMTSWEERAISRSPRRRPRVMAAAACLALVAAGVAALVAARPDTDPAAVGSPPSVAASSSLPVDTGGGGTLPIDDVDASEVQWMLPGTVPEGYELGEIFAIPRGVDSEPVVYLAYDVAPTGTENPRYGFSISAERDRGQNVADPDAEVQVVDGVDYFIETAERERFLVTWRRDGRYFSASGFVPDAGVLLTAATSIGTVSLADAAAAAAAVNEHTVAQPVFAETSFDDGMRVSVRTTDGIDGAVSLCINEPEPQCVRGDWYPDFEHQGRDAITGLFVVNGERVILRWRLLPGVETASNGAPVDTVDAGAGWFVRVAVPDGEPLPSLDQAYGDGIQSETLPEHIRP